MGRILGLVLVAVLVLAAGGGFYWFGAREGWFGNERWRFDRREVNRWNICHHRRSRSKRMMMMRLTLSRTSTQVSKQPAKSRDAAARHAMVQTLATGRLGRHRDRRVERHRS
jgi:hypothetical protein